MLEELTRRRKRHSSFSYKMRDVLTMYRGFLDYVEGTYIYSGGNIGSFWQELAGVPLF